jgi:hypothetical protein
MKPVVAYSRILTALDKSAIRHRSQSPALLLLDVFVSDLWKCVKIVRMIILQFRAGHLLRSQML